MNKTKSLPKLKSELQLIFNEYIRLRDKDKPCISCGEFKILQAGHYYPVKGYDGLRYDEDNCHGECSRCNCFDKSHLINYGRNLFDRIGTERIDALMDRADDYKKNGKKWMRYEIEDMIKTYKQKVKELKK